MAMPVEGCILRSNDQTSEQDAIEGKCVSQNADREAGEGKDGKEEEEDKDAVEGEDDSDIESLLMDTLNADVDENAQVPDAIPEDEALRLRTKLREIGPNQFILDYLTSGRYTAKRLLTAFDVYPPAWLTDGPDENCYRLLGLALLRDISARHKLPQYNTIDDVVELLRTRNNIMVITGAGISTNLGVPDFRSKDTGFYAQMRSLGFSSPEDIFSIETFRDDPSLFYTHASPTLPEPTKSTPTHAFIKLLHAHAKLLTNYTQNIDNVEANVGIPRQKLIQCHGSWASFMCQKCGFRTDGRPFYAAVKAKTVPWCPECRPPSRPLKRKRGSATPGRSRSRQDDSDNDSEYDIFEPGVLKPDITFFGEKLPGAFFERFKLDIHAVDLILVIGTSMSVAPVSEIPMAVAPGVPQVAITREKIRHVGFDVTLLGDCDVVTGELVRRLGWRLEHEMMRRGEVVVEEMDRERAVWEVRGQGEDGGDGGVGNVEVDGRVKREEEGNESGGLKGENSPQPERLAKVSYPLT